MLYDTTGTGDMLGFKDYIINHLMEAKQTRIIIMGGPGSGKSTYSEYLIRHFGIKHIYPGGMLRKEIDKGGERGQMIKKLLDQGKFAPNDIVLKLIKKEVAKVIIHTCPAHKPAFLLLKDFENDQHFVILKSF